MTRTREPCETWERAVPTLRLILSLLLMWVFARSTLADGPAEDVATEWFALAQSEGGRPLETAILGYGAERVLVVGPLAGDERQALGLVDSLVQFFEADSRRLADTTTTILRDPNPDGRADGARTNARRVDLNRNFPTRHWRQIPDRGAWLSGPEPKSAAETRAIVELVETIKPDRVVMVSESPRQELLCPTTSALSWARMIAQQSSFEVATMDLGQVSGSMIRYLDERQIPTLLILVPRDVAATTTWNRLGPALVASFDRLNVGNAQPVALVPMARPASTAGPVLIDAASESPQQVLFGPLVPIRRPGESGGEQLAGSERTIAGQASSVRPIQPERAVPLEGGNWPAGYVPPQKPILLRP